MTPDQIAKLLDFLDRRSRWLEVRDVPGRYGHGKDIAIIIDGTYRELDQNDRVRRYADQLVDAGLPVRVEADR